ncbi:MAG: YciI family protein [Desulfovibrio sp.]
MYIISIIYTAPLEFIDAMLDEHIAFLDKYYAQGTFLASGRKEPRTGGVILATATYPEELEVIMQEDPFVQQNASVYEITQFIPTKTAPALKALEEL